MSVWTAQVYQTREIHELEILAEERFGISAVVMMQRAGKAVFQSLLQHWPKAKTVAILCGTGNNGGDGYIVAQLAHAHGLQVDIWQVGDPQKLKNAGLKAYEACQKASLNIHPFQHGAKLSSADVIVDAIYGTGLHGQINKEAKLAIEAINLSGVPVLAVDIPSGLDANTGHVASTAVKAALTVTFIGMKLGLLTGQGATLTGSLVCDNLGFPAEMFALVQPLVDLLQLPQFNPFLQPRPRNSHKGNSGHVLIIGGAAGFSGAPRMAAEAALRVGAGLVSIATQPRQAILLNLTLPEVMCHGIRTPIALQGLLQKATLVVIGPGLGQSIWAKMLLRTVLESSLPLVVDADALNLLALKPLLRNNWIMTPHPGEAARLLNMTATHVQQDRLAALHKLQHKYGGVAVLKGAGTLILAPHQHAAICRGGNPGMATAGMGDVLTGVIAGLAAQGIPLAEAAKLGVCLHAEAGDLAAKKGGERGMIATDLMTYLRELANPL